MGTSGSAPSNVISTPKGGGALKGIGESFAADLNTGTGNFSVPLALPPGRNGFQPALRLEYSTGNGNGPFGFGWRIDVPGIARKTSKGTPRYHDETDVFVLSGMEDLVPVEVLATDSAGHARTRFQPRTEGLFAEIVHVRSPLETYWDVIGKDGLASRYGMARPGDAPATWSDPAALADPADERRVAAWRLSETRDQFGNRILYDHQRDVDDAAGRAWAQSYLQRIRYVDFDAGDGVDRFLVSVDFIYDARPDPFSDYRSAFEIRTTRRCKRIEVRMQGDVDAVYRIYEFVYLDERTDLSDLAARLPPNKASLLSQVRVVGQDGDATEDLPPLEFGYTGFEPVRRQFISLSGTEMPPFSLAAADVEMADLFGSGLPDIFEMGDTVRYWRNLGDGRFDLPRDMPTAPSGLRLSDPGVQLLDADGDGRVDLLVESLAISGYFPLRFDGTWDSRSFRRYRQAPSLDLKDPEVKLLDLDGDGVTDALRSGTRLDAFFNDPEQGWIRTRRIERDALQDFPGSFADPHVKWGDMSGDGLQDIVLVHDGACVYWPSLGYGNWGVPVRMRDSPRFPYGYDPKRILVGDVDGDGVADLVYVDDRRITLWINQSGNGWSAPIVIAGTPPVSDLDVVRLVDVLGSGVAGLLWSIEPGGAPRRSIDFLDFTGGVKPYLLGVMDNHVGAVTRVTYASSTQFFVADYAKRSTRWRTPLPFPVQVVQRVEVIDQLSKGRLTTEYAYHHGYWDGYEREFRGFGMVEQFDTENFTIDPAVPRQFSPPTCVRRWFHQGPVSDGSSDWVEPDPSGDFWSGDVGLLDHKRGIDDFLRGLASRQARRDALRALRGRVLRTELYALDGTARADRPYTVTEHAYGLRTEAASLDAEARLVFFPHATASRTTRWERGDDPLTQFTFTDTADYDAYGQPQKSTSIACPRGWRTHADRPAERYLATRTRTRFAMADPGGRIHDRVVRTSSYELSETRTRTLGELHRLPDDDRSLKRIAETRNYYDGPAFTGLPFGQLGPYGTLIRSEMLVLTEAILDAAYRSDPSSDVPPYLEPMGPVPWPPEYPDAFRTSLPPLAGYVFHADDPAAGNVGGYFAETVRRRCDFQQNAGGTGRGLVLGTLDPLGHESSIAYDGFDLLPIASTDPARLVTRADYDYRVLQPRRVTDPNGNMSTYTYTPLGLLQQTFVRGKRGEGDQAVPGLTMTYDFHAFADSQRADPSDPRPVYVHASRRVHHDTDTDVPQPERDETIESRAYSDGFGRLLQTRAQAEDVLFGDATFGGDVLPADQGDTTGTKQPVVGRSGEPDDAPNVTVSGWQIYDNKGRVVIRYEPFRSTGYDYAEPGDAERGQKVEMEYDPRGQVVRKRSPDGSEQRVICGVPGTIARPVLEDPDRFEPTPWEAYTYDANDNAGRTHPVAARGYRHHWDTPASILIDALGRTVAVIERNRDQPAAAGDPLPPVKEVRTTSTYDLRGNVLTIVDALGRIAFTHVYDLADRKLRRQSIDAGVRRSVFDATGSPIEGRDGKGALVLREYDALKRPVRVWARDATAETVTLREVTIYGDDPIAGPGPGPVADGNLSGKPYRAYDEAGRSTFAQYDFKGNLLEKSRDVIADDVILSVFTPPPPGWKVSAYRVDWQLHGAADLDARAAAILESTAYASTMRYDALNRIKTYLHPSDVDGARKLLRPRFNRAGALESLSLDAMTFVERIAYNAKGQRSLIAYGNGLMTRYAYDPRTSRLVRMRSEMRDEPAPLTYSPIGAALQDFAYDRDLAGNITAVHDRTPDCGIPGTMLGRDALDRAFSYDPLYRLVWATGRECDVTPSVPWDDGPRCVDVTRTRAYTEACAYDDAGNVQKLVHGANRLFTLAAGTNRLATVEVGLTRYPYTYDDNGNLIGETLSRHFEWDQVDRLRVFRIQTDDAEPSVHAQYFHDAAGQRIKKLVRLQGGQFETTTSIDGTFEQRRAVRRSAATQNTTIHVVDNQQRVALVRIGPPLTNDAGPAFQYHLADHLGSSNVVVGGAAASAASFINREEYTPYGETSFGSFARKRFRFSGKERDEESGLIFFGARSYLPWILRWASADPLIAPTPPRIASLYCYAGCNPVMLTDPVGLAPVEGGVSGCDPHVIGNVPAAPDSGAITTGPTNDVPPQSPDNLSAEPAGDPTPFSPDKGDAMQANEKANFEEVNRAEKEEMLKNGAERFRQNEAIRAAKGPKFGIDLSIQFNLADISKRPGAKAGTQATGEAQLTILARDFDSTYVLGPMGQGDADFKITYAKDPSLILDLKWHGKNSEGKTMEAPSIAGQVNAVNFEWKSNGSDFIELGLPVQPLIVDFDGHVKWQAGPEFDLHLDSILGLKQLPMSLPKMTGFGAANIGGTYAPADSDGRVRIFNSASVGLGIKGSF